MLLLQIDYTLLLLILPIAITTTTSKKRTRKQMWDARLYMISLSSGKQEKRTKIGIGEAIIASSASNLVNAAYLQKFSNLKACVRDQCSLRRFEAKFDVFGKVTKFFFLFSLK